VLLGSILLHCRDFARALQQACAHAKSTVVVAEPLRPELDTDQRLLSFVPDVENLGASVTWWGLSPGAISALLWRFGFAHTSVVRHTPRYRSDRCDMFDVPYFTMVAQRVSAGDKMQPPQLGRGLAATGRSILGAYQHWRRGSMREHADDRHLLRLFVARTASAGTACRDLAKTSGAIRRTRHSTDRRTMTPGQSWAPPASRP
jgi:hypothetical protein